MTLIYLDTETSGLDPINHEVWEVAYSIDGGPITVMHRLLSRPYRADAIALEMNRYHERINPQANPWDTPTLREVLAGATIVGANPAFDATFLREALGAAPWHHRLLDVEAMAYVLLRTPKPEGLSTIAERLRADGYDIAEPDHTAGADVACVRDVHRALLDYRSRL